MNRSSISQILRWVTVALWVVVLLGLPFTSVPVLSKLTGGNQVAPLSAIPLGLLVLVWFIPYLLRRGSLPGETIPLIIFLLVAIAINAGAFFLDITYIKDKTLLSQSIRSLITVGIGVAFYFAFAAWPKDETALQRMLQLIHIGGAVFIAWALLQAIFVLFFKSNYPALLVAVRDNLVLQPGAVTAGNRISGFAYEPSWFAHQLNVLYFPLWLAASYQRTSVFRWRILKLSFENILLGLGLVVFVLSSPRVGMIALVLMLAFLLLKIVIVIYHKVVALVTRRWIKQETPAHWVRLATGAGMMMLFVAFCFTFVWLYVQLGSRRDWRINMLTQNPLSLAEIKALPSLDENSILALGARFAFLERLTYWFDGWHIFNDYPLTGVGLGNAGFYFMARMPAAGWGTYELRDVIYRASALPNIKSLWVRLLAETGIIGLILFLSWYYVLWRSVRITQHSRSRILQMVSLAGQLALIAFLVEGFSIDSFALPYLWVITGLSCAAGAIYRNNALKESPALKISTPE